MTKTIEIIAPASGFDISNEAINKAAEKFGFIAKIPANLQIHGDDPYSASSETNRLMQLVNALESPETDIIWAFRGGYGSARLLSNHFNPHHQKLLIGYSDITAMHLYFIKHFNWQTLHARSISEYARNMGTEEETLRLKQVFAGEKTFINDFIPLNQAAKTCGAIEAKITGGNLCLIENSLGTNWEIDAKDKIVLIEEIGERGYRVDRSLLHLVQAGVFEHARAVIIGDILCAKEADGSKKCDFAISRFAQSLSIPVVQCDKIGHGKDNWPIPLNTPAVLKLGEIIELEVDSIC